MGACSHLGVCTVVEDLTEDLDYVSKKCTSRLKPNRANLKKCFFAAAKILAK
jgi:hypothetical protein